MAEVMDEASYVPHHPKKIAFLFAAMRKFAAGLEADGWRVRYTRLDDPENAGSIPGELLRRAEEAGATEVLATEPGEFRLIAALEDCPLPVHQFPDDRFLCSHADFEAWAEGRKELRMEWFYREMRRKTGLLMDGDKPEGGKWNYDHENRKPAPDDIGFGGPMHFDPTRRWRRCCPCRGAVRRELRHAAPLLVRDRSGAGAPGAGAFHRERPPALRRLPGRDAGRKPVPLPRRHIDVPQRRASRMARDLRRGRGRLQIGGRAAECRRGLHPPDHRLARIHAGDLLPRGARLRPAQCARP
jgi:hypothetical protein